MTTTLSAYNGDAKFKAALLAEVQKHVEADQLVKGTYGEESGMFKGCSVGCSIHSLNVLRGKRIPYDSHQSLAKELGIPLALARLQDTIFEGLAHEDSQQWPRRFYNAIAPGADLSMVHVDFMIAIQRRNLKRPEVKANEKVRTAIDGVLRVLLDWRASGKADTKAADSAYSAADSAAYSADSAAYSAADSAYSAAYSAACSAADSAYSAADSAAYSAACSAADSAADSAAYSAAYSAEYKWMAACLLKLMRAVKPTRRKSK